MSNKNKPSKKHKQSSTSDEDSHYSHTPKKEMMEGMIRKIMQEVFDDFKTFLMNLVEEKQAVLRNEIDILAAENDMLKKEMVSLNQKLTDTNNRFGNLVQDLERKMDSAKKQRDVNTEHSNRNEQYSRLWSVRIHGHPQKEREDCTAQVVELLHSKLQLADISSKDIELAHRTGRAANGKSRAIIVRFFNREIRQRVLSNRKKLKGSKCVITEDLTTLNYGLLSRVRANPEIKSAWSWNGNIFGLTGDDIKIQFSPFTDIQSSIRDARI